MNKYFKDKIIVVTGAGSGIGRAICHKVSSFCLVVIGIDIDEKACQETMSNVKCKYEIFVCDVADQTTLTSVIDQIYDKYKCIDILFNNAGIGIAGEVQYLTLEDWDRLISTNIRGVIHGAHLVYKRMVKQRSGHIVNTACLAGLIPFPDIAAYATTKHAIVGFSKALQFEAASYNIKITMVCPSAVDTPIVSSSKYIGISREFVEKIWNRIPKMDAAYFVEVMLQKISKGKKVIIIPLSTKILWWVYRFFPTFLTICIAFAAKKVKEKNYENTTGSREPF